MLVIDDKSGKKLLGLLTSTWNEENAAPTTPTIPKPSTLTGNDAMTARPTTGYLEKI